MIDNRLKISSVLTFVFLLFALVTGKLSNSGFMTEINREKFETVIRQKQEDLTKYLLDLRPYITDEQLDAPSQKFLDIVSGYVSQKQLYLAVYRNWNLKVWPTEKVVLPDVFDPDLFQGKVVQLGYDFYIPLHTRYGNTDIVILAYIKTQYPRSTEYLVDEFARGFSVRNDVQITMNPLAENRIYDANKNFLFSLEPGKGCFWSDFFLWISLILFLAAMVSFFRFVEGLTDKLTEKTSLTWAIIISFAFSLAVRILMLLTGFPGILYDVDLFWPSIYASGWGFTSLGDSLLTVFWLFFFILMAHQKIKKHAFKSTEMKNGVFLLVMSGFALSMFAFFINRFTYSLIIDSVVDFELYKILGTTGYTFVGLLIVLILICCYLLLAELFLRLLAPHFSFKKIAIIQLTELVLLISIANHFNNISPWVSLYFVLFTTVLYYYFYRNSYRHSFAVIITILTALFFVWQANGHYQFKWVKSMEVASFRLSSSDDIGTEFHLRSISEKVVSDTTLLKIIAENHKDYVRASNYVNNRYYSEIGRLYNVGILFFNAGDSVFVDTSHQQWQPWRKYYTDRTNRAGTRIMDSDYFRLNRSEGLTRYIGFHPIQCSQATCPTLVVELDEKSFDLSRGLHSFLFKDRFGYNSKNPDFSYGNYFQEKLISKSGNFNYKTHLEEEVRDRNTAFHQLNFDGYRHLIYHYGDNQTLIVSEPEVGMYDLLIWFSYVFVTYYIIVLLVSFIFGLSFARVKLLPTLQNRIQLTMALALFVSIIIIGAGSLYFNFQGSHRKHMEMIDEKINSVVNEMCGHFAKVKELYRYDEDYINFLMRKYSGVFNLDVSLFDISGNLIATSRKELFDEQFLGQKMNFSAYRAMTSEHRSKAIFYENIGKLSFYSAYVPLVNANGNILGYINLPFFGQDSARTKDLTSMVVALMNIYVLLILFTILLAVFVSNKITKPLLIVRRKLQELDIKRQNTPIEYYSQDEIGDLVKEYNRMVAELSKNTELLAQRERESAWQSMARQVAHEIKNPLTPMKLNVQLLERAWEDRAYDFDKRLHKVCKTLIEQIDALSHIATEFSSFAKMPKERLGEVDIHKAIVSCANLFEETKNAQITVEADKSVTYRILADSDQINRVFTNLIKNAIQAIPEERLGLINIKLKASSEHVVISVSDNGEGISPEMQKKLFQPNFTTKTSGMGLGLAMVKNIISVINGTIWFETIEHEGTTFYIQLPLVGGGQV